MTSDQADAAQKAVSGFTPGYFDDSAGVSGWRSAPGARASDHSSAGSYGWNGGYGIIWYNDPAEDMTADPMNQRAWEPGGSTSPVFLDFFTAAYQAIDD